MPGKPDETNRKWEAYNKKALLATTQTAQKERKKKRGV
jgi:hypothetical protein